MENNTNEAEQTNELSHEEQMINRVDEHNSNMETTLNTDQENANQVSDEELVQSEEETLLAGKYKNQEDLEKAYLDLQKKLGETKEEVSESEEVVEESEITEEKAKEIVEGKDINFEDLAKEYQENGDLTEETYKSLEDAGIPKEMVDTYIEGQQVLLDAKVQEIYGAIGGEEEYNSMIEWAGENLNETEKETFNQALNVNDNVTQFTIQNLYSRYKSNTPGKLISGNSVQSGNLGYQTKSEMQRDMNSRDYHKDAKFRAIVQRKISNTDWM